MPLEWLSHLSRLDQPPLVSAAWRVAELLGEALRCGIATVPTRIDVPLEAIQDKRRRNRLVGGLTCTCTRREVVADGTPDGFYCWLHAGSRVDELNWAPGPVPEGSVAEDGVSREGS